MKQTVFFWITDQGACGYYRSYLPARALQKHTKKYEVLLGDNPMSGLGAAVVIIQRPYSDKAIGFLKWLKSKGKKIVVESDDDFFHVAPDNPVFPYIDADVQRQFAEALEIADAVTVSTAPLKAAYGRFNANISILPNCIDEEVLGRQKVDNDKLVVGWQGTFTHQEDLRLIKSTINAVTRSNKLKFVLAGYDPGFFRRAEFRQGRHFDIDLTFYELFQDFDIGLCPLKDTPFNECKSDIKFVEYATLSIPTIASKSAAYATIEHGKTGYVARNAKDWESLIARLVEDQDERARLGLAAKTYVTEHRTIQTNIHRWEEMIDSL